MPTILEQDWQRAFNPNGKKVSPLKMPPMVFQIARIFFYNGWAMGAGRVMAAGRALDETTQMLAIMEIMDCIEKDALFLGKPKEDFTGPDNPDETLPTVN